ncbi:MAG: 30S ribosomal protein S12 methylthiotransferase RimO [Acidobacteriota bacterium]|nr:30S ribosomal protein S12 methylthiotransferase RimO [Acidobacteriota bacterium]
MSRRRVRIRERPTDSMPRVGLVSLGCPKNQVDSEVMLGMLAREGYEAVPDPRQADVIVVNTCSFIGPARQESIDTILEMAQYKKTGAASRLVVAGCMVERYRREILESMPEVDCVIGTNEVERIVDACRLEERKRELPAPATPYLYHEFTPRLLTTPSHTAYIKIAEGCDHTCSFCVIPQMRGRMRSRRFESVVREAENLTRRGARELTLVGQDNTSYGDDLGIRDGLATLLKEIARIPELVWLRFLYCYPNRVTDRLIEAVAESPKAVKYFDIPLQHASAPVLKAMRRGSGASHFLKLIQRIRAAIPGVTLRTSFITGFPGETEDDFKALMDFAEAAEFDRLGVFRYSNEESSASFHLPNPVTARVSYNRSRRLRALQRQISRRKLKALIGRRIPVLVEGLSAETDLLFAGRMESQAPEVDGQVFINDFRGPAPRSGEYRWATVTRSSDYDVVARVEAEYFAPPLGEAGTVGGADGETPFLVQIQPAILTAAPAGVVSGGSVREIRRA